MTKALIAFCVLAGLGAGVYLIAGQQNPMPTPPRTAEQPPTTALADPDLSLATVPIEVFEQDGLRAGRVLIDVRTPEEYATGHLPHARNIDFRAATFRAELEKLDRVAPYALYCRSGNRSGQTLTLMRELGFTNVIDLAGGVTAWTATNRTLCNNC